MFVHILLLLFFFTFIKTQSAVVQTYIGFSVEFKIRVQDKVLVYIFFQTLSSATEQDDSLCLDLP